tara:strand:+ start:101 stop:448 length:348 start_codon:yes stop_codon:yes gene_type:complete
MVIDKEEALELLTARFDHVQAIPKLSRQEREAELIGGKMPRYSFYQVKDRSGDQTYEMVVRLREFRSGDHHFEFSVSQNEPLYHRLDIEMPDQELVFQVQMLLDSMNRILLRPAV